MNGCKRMLCLVPPLSLHSSCQSPPLYLPLLLHRGSCQPHFFPPFSLNPIQHHTIICCTMCSIHSYILDTTIVCLYIYVLLFFAEVSIVYCFLQSNFPKMSLFCFLLKEVRSSTTLELPDSLSSFVVKVTTPPPPPPLSLSLSLSLSISS